MRYMLFWKLGSSSIFDRLAGGPRIEKFGRLCYVTCVVFIDCK